MSSPTNTSTMDLNNLYGPLYNQIQSNQAQHRVNILKSWNITPGSKVIEIGCGQGDCTTVLASLVGPNGHIDAIDPAPLSYGSPETLGEAHARISQSDIGKRISWHQTSPLDFLESVPEGSYDVAVFVHSSWYFTTPSELDRTVAMLRGKTKRLCIAEYALSATEKGAQAHVFAAFARASLEVYNPDSNANIRNIFSPKALRGFAEGSGWTLMSDGVVVPGETLEDGRWEVGTVLGEDFLAEATDVVPDERVLVLLEGMREAVKGAVEDLKKVRTMDVWVAMFE